MNPTDQALAPAGGDSPSMRVDELARRLPNRPIDMRVAAVLNLIPYIGAIVPCVCSAVVAPTEFGSIGQALLVACASAAPHIVSGSFVTPWLTPAAPAG